MLGQLKPGIHSSIESIRTNIRTVKDYANDDTIVGRLRAIGISNLQIPDTCILQVNLHSGVHRPIGRFSYVCTPERE